MRAPLAIALLCAALLLADPAHAQGVEPSQGATVVVVLGSVTILLAMAASALTIASKLAERREKRTAATTAKEGVARAELDRVEARLAALERSQSAEASGQFIAVQSEETTRARISALERKVARVAATCAVRHPPSEGAPE